MKTAMRTQVAIIGGGPAGLVQSHILARNAIDSAVLERQSRQHVLPRIRAGVLETGTADLPRAVGLGERMDGEGHPHAGTAIAWEGARPILHRHQKIHRQFDDGAWPDCNILTGLISYSASAE
jgi:2-polyprenyl-6-methoxyphenol hydroxylase-like FAD-dependent oxidoreductase